MLFKSKRGYSLIEIGVGVLILTVFLVCSIALFNGCYNTYRMIQQRNLATNLAVSNMESLLQTNSDILTGFFTEELNVTTNEYELVANSEFDNYVKNNFNTKFKERYARLNGLNSDAVDSLTADERAEYIYKDKNYLIHSYIADTVEDLTEAEFNSAEVQNGKYAMLTNNVIETGNPVLLNPSAGAEASLNGEMAVRKTILRLPLTDTTAYGNEVLKVKVEVLYTNKINTSNLTNEDIKVITLESIKIAG